MKRTALPLLLVASFACGGPEDFDLESIDSTEEALIGGNVAQPGQWDSTLRVNGCTMARVGSRFILTAAHCVMASVRDSSGYTTIYPRLRSSYLPGQTLTITNSKILDGSQATHQVVIDRVFVHPAFVQACDPHCHDEVSLEEPHAPDVAVIRTTTSLPAEIPAAYISTSLVQSGDPVTIMGYGCERSALLSATGYPRLKYEVTEARYSDHFDLRQGYIHTWGLEDASTEASLCPGDSGGPVYRGASFSKIVGVNAYYLFDDRNSGVSSTNLHTRIGAGNPHHVEDWLRSIIPSTRFVY